ncbi:hypothetical protein N0V93_003007 [Gnomoniopsis smithogilvyi]|uniref:Bud22 domain-containing protein n=1 Tax=Gnomoniopsis smithogilvyi TaxID=1191159 RepID=A0A9W9CZH0_9PEZI|nr:hypothetical protein N0V93_003007 [Gnomoniopsis smithogilvyi]
MPKRKREEDVLGEKLAHHHQELSRTLKAAKGFERQRMAKRQRDPKSTPEKRARIEKEIVVLKSVDLHSVAYAHLCASLLKIKAVVESPKLPEEVKNGVPKPEISEEEKSLLHNVTSALYNQPKVREAVEKAVADICRVLHVPVPDKKGKLKKGDKKAETTARKDPEEQPADRTVDHQEKAEKSAKHGTAKTENSRPSENDEESDEEETEFNGFSDDEDDESDEEVEEKEEKVVSRFNDRLGSSDDDEYDTANEELDPMEVTDLSASEGSDDEISLVNPGSEEEASEEEASSDQDEDEDEDEEDSESSAVSPPHKTRKEAKKGAPIKVKDSHYLPSLMGGYISGSESEASDIDVAPTRKNRRGQRARQAIAEKKFKDKAKHLAKAKAGRDDGWDLKRGAVGGNERTPWKKGVRTPLGKKQGHSEDGEQEPRRPKPPTKKDNEGPLHASWEAKKKAKEAQETAVFQGKRVVFD